MLFSMVGTYIIFSKVQLAVALRLNKLDAVRMTKCKLTANIPVSITILHLSKKKKNQKKFDFNFILLNFSYN
jgi:hypothetical protein